MGCAGNSKEAVKNRSQPNIANNYNNDTQDLDTDNFNEEDYPIFQSNWSKKNIQNFRFVSIGMPYKGLVFYDKLFITIDHDQKKAKLVKIEKEEKGKSKKKHLIQKIYSDRISFEDFESDLKAISYDLNIIDLEDLYSKGPSTDYFIVFRNLNGEYIQSSYLFDKKTNTCSKEIQDGIIGSSGGGSTPDSFPSTPENIVKSYMEDISKYIDYKNLDLKILDKYKDEDLNVSDFYESDFPLFQAFWYKNIFQNFRLITAALKEDGKILINRLFITIDFYKNQTKFVKMEANCNGDDIKRHLTQKIYKQKCSLKQFQKDIESYNKDFGILLKNDIFSNHPSKDLFIVAQNKRGNIRKYSYTYDKETNKCSEESLIGSKTDYFDMDMENIPKALAGIINEKVMELVEDINEDDNYENEEEEEVEE